MKKKFLVPALAAAIVGGGVAGSLVNSSAFASSNDSKSVEVTGQQEQQQLAKEATITKQDAISAALKDVAGKATNTELEDENGTVVYGVSVTDNKGKQQDVKVDAKTGKVLKVEADDKEEGEKGEKAEKEGKESEAADQQEQQQLAKSAKITADESNAIALKEVPGKVTNTELQDENGTAVYGVEITDDQGKAHDVKVDAKTGKVLNVGTDDENESESGSEEE
ncbi:PepSY domain-containing protein [Mesobacillus stamsii]|uniref:Membrane protein YkoI n=1 Tax=Mesobacillus stamsii TaxID=225347 RepID=A0ABU0FZK5_9BACI|nr:PepSY domain-containing protein [Mesobacillus stamsii]MDQ0414762.1 putative membrane protein YkoI [Mesobacillus stamsii]